jgi:hypothetical protein
MISKSKVRVVMAKKTNKKTTKKVAKVRSHTMNVPVSKKNPTGKTILDEYLRHFSGNYLNREDIEQSFKDYNQKDIPYPTSGKILDHKTADDYDELIAVWTDYFNKILRVNPPLDPDVFKALIASESGFVLMHQKIKLLSELLKSLDKLGQFYKIRMVNLGNLYLIKFVSKI